jgi:outer membrane protein OmpA-like peptidoglycan-associated protein
MGERIMRCFYGCYRLGAVITLISVFFVGCGGIPTNHPDLVRARDAYDDAQSKTGVSENAPVEMYEAKQALQRAEQAENAEELEHLAYLAERRSQIAVAVAAQRSAKKEIEKLSKEKNNVLLNAREAEIESKLREIQEKESEVERARLEAEKARAQAEIATIRAQELEQALADLNAKMTDRGYVLTLGDVLFEFDRAELLPGAYRTIDKLVAFLKKYPNRNVLIEGHTDSIGTADYNLDLSQRRADSVRVALVEREISLSRISTKGYGKTYPVASNDTEAGRQRNRRVEIVILDEGVSGESMLR